MNEQTRKPSLLAEVALWFAASVMMIGVGVMGLHALMKTEVPAPAADLGYALVAALLTLTWGSWAALIWSKRRLTRTLMGLSVLVPGLGMALVGFWAFVHMPELFKVWRPGLLVIGVHGVGAALFSAVMLGQPAMRGRRDETSDRALRARELAAGWLLYPLLTFGCGAAIAMSVVGWTSLGTISEMLTSPARWIAAAMGLTMVTTVIPASAAILCRRVARALRLT
ncbi:hypothetical protein DV096_15760 [Bradymonadaceae bacterium TMQ3]|uniref:Uncharacterized protein n=1 Tax=Lujinxingia sediminis TaxID=2480984 RepID=A0ABY0CS18_9DELT|nr:hypothetical protein [Lujinxingia sediminis]RDV36967.1 hypothetical protein DV096_15760 [Bradymonadaceae bacterium TMQ3]RVU42953.1 hypothetical protein EA187_14040 [Lujinxingia sediminis]TXC73090.1 hypothetical protein FRC91_16700 [Bradymonadales bacterium TMQ1]